MPPSSRDDPARTMPELRSELLRAQLRRWTDQVATAGKAGELFELEMWLRSFERFFRIGSRLSERETRALALRKKVEAMKDQYYTYEVFLNYQCVYLLADAIERARSRDRAAILDALANSTWDKHFMPYGPTKFVGGQNQGAAPLMMQVLKNDIRVVLPNTWAETDPVYPVRA